MIHGGKEQIHPGFITLKRYERTFPITNVKQVLPNQNTFTTAL